MVNGTIGLEFKQTVVNVIESKDHEDTSTERRQEMKKKANVMYLGSMESMLNLNK